VLSRHPGDTKKVVWDEYFLYKRYSENNSGDNKTALSALMSPNRSFRSCFVAIDPLFGSFYFAGNEKKATIIPPWQNPGMIHSNL